MKTQVGLRAAAGAGVAIATGGAAYAATQAFFADVCMAKKKPLAMRLFEQPQSAELSPVERQIRAGQQALEQAGAEAVEIVAFDGTTLRGHVLHAGKPKRLVIAMHGWRSCWSRDFSLSWPFWQAEGCTVLYPDQRALGNSGGRYMCFGALERYDCLYWLRYVEGRFGTELPVYLCGISMGAATVMMAASLDLGKSVHGILADCGFTSPYEIWKHVYEDNFHIPFGAARVCEAIFRRRTGLGLAEVDTRTILAQKDLPVLLIHGAEDKFVPTDMSRQNYAAAKGPKELLIVPGASHGLSYAVDPAAYEDAVRRFFAAHDGAPHS